jgi:hypothetical protein
MFCFKKGTNHKKASGLSLEDSKKTKENNEARVVVGQDHHIIDFESSPVSEE